MKVLIMMLFNLKTETYHPIFYFEHPFPGDCEMLRFRSKGHRTVGLKDRNEALATIDPEVVSKLTDGYSIAKELDTDLPWDGENIPADNQLRSKEWERINFS